MNVAIFCSGETGSGKSEGCYLPHNDATWAAGSQSAKENGMFSDHSGILGLPFVYPVMVLALGSFAMIRPQADIKTMCAFHHSTLTQLDSEITTFHSIYLPSLPPSCSASWHIFGHSGILGSVSVYHGAHIQGHLRQYGHEQTSKLCARFITHLFAYPHPHPTRQ